jgi:O-antigen/teichoic acid export membrane protein
MVVVVGILIIAGLLWLHYLQWITLVVAALAFSVLSAYKAILNGIQNAARQRHFVALHETLDAWLKIGLALVIIYWIGSSSVAVIVGYTCSCIVIIFSQFTLFGRTIPVQKERSTNRYNWIKEIWIYSLPFTTWGIFGWAQQSSASWALGIFATTDDVGFYSVLSQLGYIPIQIVTGLALNFLMPIFFEKAGDSSCSVRNKNVSELINKIAMLGLLFTGCAFVLAELLHSYIFKIFVDNRYLSVSHFLPWLVLSGGIFSVAQVFATRLMALMVPRKMIFASIGSSLIGISSAYLGVYYFSLLGAITSLLVHAISYLVWIVVIGKKVNKQA